MSGLSRVINRFPQRWRYLAQAKLYRALRIEPMEYFSRAVLVPLIAVGVMFIAITFWREALLGLALWSGMNLLGFLAAWLYQIGLL